MTNTHRWQPKPIKELGNVITGRTPPTKRPDCFGTAHPFITPSEMEGEKWIHRTDRGLSPQGAALLKNNQIPPNSVVISCIGWQMGKVAKVSRPAFTNQQINTVITNGLVDSDFLYYSLATRREELKRLGSGGTRTPILNKSRFEEIAVPLPSLPIQRKIASILSAYDDLIENNTRRIEILEEMAQAIYREWFVNFRFPGHEKVGMVDSPLGEIPEGWEVAKLSSLVDTQYGYTQSASESQVGPKYLRGTDINKRPYIQWDSVPYCAIGSNDHAKYQLSEGDILVIRMADPGKVGIIEKDIDAVFASYLIRLIIASNDISPYFLFYFLNSERYQDYITGASTGTTRKSASAKVITDIDIAVPSEEIRREFEEQGSIIRQRLTNLLDKNHNLRRTRDLLLPKLISGEVDVSEIDIQEEAEAATASP